MSHWKCLETLDRKESAPVLAVVRSNDRRNLWKPGVIGWEGPETQSQTELGCRGAHLGGCITPLQERQADSWVHTLLSFKLSSLPITAIFHIWSLELGYLLSNESVILLQHFYL